MKVELGFFSLNNPRSAVRSRASCTALLTEDGEEAGKPPSASQVILKLGWSLENSFIRFHRFLFFTEVESNMQIRLGSKNP